MAAGDRVDRRTDLTGLTDGERLLVWSWRKIVTGGGRCPLIAREFSLLCGEDAGEVLATLYTFLQALAYAGRRQFQIGYPCYASLTSDERQMLALIAVAQIGDANRLESNLRILTRAALRPAIAIAVRALGTALLEHDLRLSLPASNFNPGIAVKVQSRHHQTDGSLLGSKGNTVRLLHLIG